MSTATVHQPKRRHIFRWFFLAVQALFVVWLIAGTTSAANSASNSCGNTQLCHDSAAAGAGIGAMLIIVLWVAADVILGVGYLIFRKR